MSKASKKQCSLEEEYAFEHKARIKAENYISELWEMHGELEKEVSRLQSIINKGEHLKKEKVPIDVNLELKTRIKKIYADRKRAIKKMEKWII